ncbi:MAG: hypothetical protein WBG02_06410 [Candidatus Acidiferrum sp.]
MPSIEIPESLFARLQELAVPLVDTPVTVIERLLSSYAGQKTRQTSATVEPVQAGASDQKAARMGQPQREFESNAAPSLRHTRVISAEFAGNRANGWNDLVRVAHIEALRRLGSLEAVRRITTSKMILGRANSEQEKRGYRYIAEMNACVQNVDAEHCWVNTFRLAKTLKVPVEVDFEWLHKSGAAHPGKTARLAWKPKEEGSAAL